MDSRTEFWRQQKPIYARKRKDWVKVTANPKDPLNYILQQLESIDNCMLKPKMIIVKFRYFL